MVNLPLPSCLKMIVLGNIAKSQDSFARIPNAVTQPER